MKMKNDKYILDRRISALKILFYGFYDWRSRFAIFLNKKTGSITFFREKSPSSIYADKKLWQKLGNVLKFELGLSIL